MSEFIFKLPDLGEGTVEAEIVEWHVTPGDVVTEGDIICDVMTDKANVEVPAPTSGTVLRTTGEPGDVVPVGAELIAFAIGASGENAERSTPPEKDPLPEPPPPTTVAAPEPAEQPPKPEAEQEPPAPAPPDLPTEQSPSTEAAPVTNRAGGKVLASPALRRRANELGIDLANVQGSGPRGRILRRDLEGIEPGPSREASPTTPADDVEIVKVIGVRRVIAQRMQAAKQEIPHFAYVEEVDVTALESLRQAINARETDQRLTFLPFIASALIKALPNFPQCNARYDATANALHTHRGVHLGIAAQTDDGLKVPVVRNAHLLDLRKLAHAINQVTQRAKDGSASAQELQGSTITITSLGKLGGIVSTPVINAPEMGIIGVNKAVQRPMVVAGEVQTRLMMNLSSSFDHRFVDGYDAAALIQEIKTLLEEPGLLFM